MSASLQSLDAKTAGAEQELTDGFHLIIDALKHVPDMHFLSDPRVNVQLARLLDGAGLSGAQRLLIAATLALTGHQEATRRRVSLIPASRDWFPIA